MKKIVKLNMPLLCKYSFVTDNTKTDRQTKKTDEIPLKNCLLKKRFRFYLTEK